MMETTAGVPSDWCEEGRNTADNWYLYSSTKNPNLLNYKYNLLLNPENNPKISQLESQLLNFFGKSTEQIIFLFDSPLMQTGKKKKNLLFAEMGFSVCCSSSLWLVLNPTQQCRFTKIAGNQKRAEDLKITGIFRKAQTQSTRSICCRLQGADFEERTSPAEVQFTSFFRLFFILLELCRSLSLKYSYFLWLNGYLLFLHNWVWNWGKVGEERNREMLWAYRKAWQRSSVLRFSKIGDWASTFCQIIWVGQRSMFISVSLMLRLLVSLFLQLVRLFLDCEPLRCYYLVGSWAWANGCRH